MDTNLSPQKNYLSLALFLLALFLLLIVMKNTVMIQKKITEKPVISVITLNDPFSALSLEAKTAYVYDIKNNRSLYSKNEESQLPLASLAKVMTALLARELVPKGTTITISKEAIKQEGDSGLFENEMWRLSDISDLTLLSSSNDGARAVASAINAFLNPSQIKTDAPADFLDAMNKKAATLGMTQTFFLNESGLDSTESVSGAYGSAKDIALLVAYAIEKYPDLFEATRYSKLSFESLSDFKHIEKNTNERVETLPELLASKTGFTDLAGGNLVIAFEAGPMRPIIVSVLGSSASGRFDDVGKLVWASIEKINTSL